MLFCSLKKGLTPKIRMWCFVTIHIKKKISLKKRSFFNLSYVGICFRTLAVIFGTYYFSLNQILLFAAPTFPFPITTLPSLMDVGQSVTKRGDAIGGRPLGRICFSFFLLSVASEIRDVFIRNPSMAFLICALCFLIFLSGALQCLLFPLSVCDLSL